MTILDELILLKSKNNIGIELKETRNAEHVKSFKMMEVFLAAALKIFWILFRVNKNPLKSMMIIGDMKRKIRDVHGDFKFPGYIKAGGRYYWAIHTPAWPSSSFTKHIENELKKLNSNKNNNGFLQTIIFSVTNKCNLKCEHCFEWQNLDSEEYLSLDDLKLILKKLQDRGISQVQISGGEPLHRFDDVLELLKFAKSGTDFILLTSGFGLTADKAVQLREAGLTGVNISLDHWDEEKHNTFRNNDKSFEWVKKAAVNSYDAGLLVAFSLCATKDFTTLENLWRYLNFTASLGAGFIQILEPRSVGKFGGKDVELSEDQVKLISDFYLNTNSNSEFNHLPIVYFPGYHQRHYGCFGAGERYMFIDAKGNMHACPFCQNPMGNALRDNWDETIIKIRSNGCHVFETARD